MALRRFQPEDYEEVSQWWRAHGWAPVPLQALPVTGLIVPGIAAGWLYKTDSSLAWLEWLVTNPNAAGEARHAALNEVIEAALKEAEIGGAAAVFTSLSDKSLLGRYQRHGFVVSDTGMTNMVRVLGGGK